MGEKIRLVFSDGSTYNMNTANLFNMRKALNMQKQKGDPREVIGEGKVAAILRREYAKKYQGIKGSSVAEMAVELSGKPRTLVENAYSELRKRLRV